MRLKLEFLKFILRVLNFANLITQDISRVFDFANLAKIDKIHKNLYSRELVRLKYEPIIWCQKIGQSHC